MSYVKNSVCFLMIEILTGFNYKIINYYSKPSRKQISKYTINCKVSKSDSLSLHFSELKNRLSEISVKRIKYQLFSINLNHFFYQHFYTHNNNYIIRSQLLEDQSLIDIEPSLRFIIWENSVRVHIIISLIFLIMLALKKNIQKVFSLLDFLVLFFLPVLGEFYIFMKFIRYRRAHNKQESSDNYK